MSRYTKIVYIGRYLALKYIERLISTTCCFFGDIRWSVKCTNWVSKLNNFFLTFKETAARFLFEGFNIIPYGKSISDSPIRFFFFFYLVCELFKGLLQSLFQPVDCMRCTSEMSRNISINLYLRRGIAIYGKFYLYCLYHLRLFCSVDCGNLVCKLCITIWECQDTQTLFILECI